MDTNTAYTSLADFLQDEGFLRWQMLQDKEAERQWEAWLVQHPDKQELVQEAVRTLQATRLSPAALEENEKLSQLVFIYSQAKQKSKRKQLYAWSAAACLLVLLSTSLVKFTHFFSPQPKLEAKLVVVQEEEEIRLILPDNKVLSFADKTDLVLTEQGELRLETEENQTPVLAAAKKGLNTLVVPKGKRTSLTLPDKTKVWLNAGTTVSFPSVFESGIREIFLSGEIYLHVAKNAQAPFVVNTDKFAVTVLGTQFAVSAYADEKTHTVVLEEGSVEVTPALEPANKLRLQPNQMFELKASSYQSKRS